MKKVFLLIVVIICSYSICFAQLDIDIGELGVEKKDVKVKKCIQGETAWYCLTYDKDDLSKGLLELKFVQEKKPKDSEIEDKWNYYWSHQTTTTIPECDCCEDCP